MSYTLFSFQNIISNLLQSQTEQEEVTSAQALEIVYQELLDKISTAFAHRDTKETVLSGGIALSSQHALDCLKDSLRTVRFIKSMHAAIKDTQKQFPNDTIEILYAGCGPVAPIILPLLHLYQPSEVQVTLLDITATSKFSVTALIDVLGAQSFFKPFQLCDAISYKHPDKNPLHIIVSEVMDKALLREPQVRVTQNLVPQLAENGIFIPQRIDIFQEFSFYGKEPYFDIYKNVLKLGPTYDTIGRSQLFSISEAINTNSNFNFTSEIIDAPQNIEAHPDVCIFAELIIYKSFVLTKSQSLLSNPISVFSLFNLKSKQFQLTYTTNEIPKWILTPIA